jgi:hypothetical protein
MDHNDEIVETHDLSLGQEVGKAVLLSTATSAGSIAGLMLIGLVASQIKGLVDKRKAKKNATPEEETK